MIKEITFKNFGHDCMYFNFTSDGSFKSLDKKVNVKALIPDEKDNITKKSFTIMLNERYLNGITPKKSDIIYLDKKLYEITTVSENNNGTYKTSVRKYEKAIK